MTPKRIVSKLYQEKKSIPFAWGSNDCLCFASECAEAITGHDPAVAIKQRYTSEVSVRRLMVREGWESVGDLAASILPEIPLGQAQSGDWVHVEDDSGHDCIGVVCGHRIAVKTELGLSQVPLSRAKRAFRIE